MCLGRKEEIALELQARDGSSYPSWAQAPSTQDEDDTEPKNCNLVRMHPSKCGSRAWGSQACPIPRLLPEHNGVSWGSVHRGLEQHLPALLEVCGLIQDTDR